jgi:hypothetical protein
VLGTGNEPSAGIRPFKSYGFLRDASMVRQQGTSLLASPWYEVSSMVSGLYSTSGRYIGQMALGLKKYYKTKLIETKSAKRKLTSSEYAPLDVSPSSQLGISDAATMDSRGNSRHREAINTAACGRRRWRRARGKERVDDLCTRRFKRSGRRQQQQFYKAIWG